MLLGHDLIHRFAKERLRLFLTGHLCMYYGAGVLLPLGEYAWVRRSPWLLAIAVVCAAQCVALGTALRLVRRGWAARSASSFSDVRKAAALAADDERRRLERDLHDGAQQHLVALAVLIQLARTAEHDRYQALLIEASRLVETAIAEIRRLAHGIYPPLLASGGLAQALPAAAAHASVPVQLDLHGLGRYPASIEAALYYCCSEALQNAAKHAGPDTTATITAHADEQMLSLTISDTGRGFDPATIGTGLTNMTDRLSAIGGHLTIDTAPGRGTRITATIANPVQPGSRDCAETVDLALV